MSSRENKKNQRRQRVIASLLCIFIIMLGVGLFRTWQRNHAIDQEIAELERKAATIEDDNSKTTELIKYFNSTAYLEQKARTDLGLKKEGEHITVIPDSAGLLATATTGTEQSTSKESNPRKWLRYFFH